VRSNAKNAVVLFDLDGTLIDSAAGVLRSLRVAFDEHGLRWPGFRSDIVGPPLYRLLPGVIGDEATDKVLASYRRNYFEWGLYHSPPFAGVQEMLDLLAVKGFATAVATSKAEVFATKILGEKGWGDHFIAVCGDTFTADRPTKSAVIREAIARIGHSKIVMVGDRKTDVSAALENSLPCYGAGWGYGALSELAAATEVLRSPGEVVPSLFRHRFDRMPQKQAD
jgi:phosphoglycolate phosphatase